MNDDLIVLSGNDGTIGVFVDGAADNSTALLLTEGGHIGASSAETDTQGRSASDYHSLLLSCLPDIRLFPVFYRTTPVSTSFWNWK